MVDIGIGSDEGQSPTGFEPCLVLVDDGYYWFLYPLLEELQAATGQDLDLYGDATFAGTDLDALARMLSEARRRVEMQPESWEVHHPTRRKVFKPVNRAQFLQLIGIWEQGIALARQTGRAIICLGD